MKEAFEKIVERLEEERELSYSDFDRYVEEVSPCLDSEYDDFFHMGLERAVKVIKQVAKEYGPDINVGSNNWIPCEKELPKYAENLVDCTIKRLSDGHMWVQNLIYSRIEDKWKWSGYPEDRYVDMDAFAILAWMSLPEPYQPKGD